MGPGAAMDELRDRWSHLYKEHLPALAKARDEAQPKWPVYLDHCFARIILDNAIGKNKPWMEVLKQPAVNNMNESQLQDAIKLGEQIATGEADLVAMNQKSLQLRGKKRRAGDMTEKQETPKKKQKNDPTISAYFPQSPPSDTKAKVEGDDEAAAALDEKSMSEGATINPDMSVQIQRIADSSLTAFRKQTLTMLCQIPRGRYSTYQAMSDHITKTSHKTCARAVGNAMRNNPFAPEVPCHRILAADGTLGGFCGHWGENGKFASRKHELLHEEGVRFGSNGKVKGPPFRQFT